MSSQDFANELTIAWHKESSKVNFFSLFGQLFFIIGLLIYRKYGVSLILLVTFAEGFSQFIKNIIETIYVFNKYPELKPKKNNVDFYYSKGIMSFGIKMFILQISALILNSTDNLLILILTLSSLILRIILL